jgi:hypothetical protein
MDVNDTKARLAPTGHQWLSRGFAPGEELSKQKAAIVQAVYSAHPRSGRYFARSLNRRADGQGGFYYTVDISRWDGGTLLSQDRLYEGTDPGEAISILKSHALQELPLWGGP